VAFVIDEADLNWDVHCPLLTNHSKPRSSPHRISHLAVYLCTT